MMSSSDWAELVRHCKPVSNVNLVCRDGVVYSHKIVLASVSDFVKTLLSDIPVGDDISVFLPDFSKKEVNKFLENILLKRKSDNYDLSIVLMSSEIDGAPEVPKTKEVKQEAEDFSDRGSDELTEYLADKYVLGEEKVSEDEFTSETAELLQTSLEVKMEATEYFMTELKHPDPHELHEINGIPKKRRRKTKCIPFHMPIQKIQKRGENKSESRKHAKYPTEMPRRERLRMSAKKWRDKNHELVKLKQLQDRLEIKKRRLKDPEFNAMMKARQAERKRRSRALKKAAEQLALLEMEPAGMEPDPGVSQLLNHGKEEPQNNSKKSRKCDNRKKHKNEK